MCKTMSRSLCSQVGRGCPRALFTHGDSFSFVSIGGSYHVNPSNREALPQNQPTFPSQVPAITNSNHLPPCLPRTPNHLPFTPPANPRTSSFPCVQLTP